MALAVAVLVAGGTTWWLMARESGGSGSSGSQASESTATETRTPAQAALDALPRGNPLPEETLVVPRVGDGSADLYLVDAASGATTLRLTTALGNDIGPLVSPDRRTVVYQHTSDAGTELRSVASDGSGDRSLFAADLGCPAVGRPAWNPAEPTQLALTCAGGDGSSLRVVTLDGAIVRTLDPGIAVIDDLSFSPDGSRLVYWGAPDTSTPGGSLFSLPADGSGGGAQQLTDSTGDADPVWSPDGQHIAFRRETATVHSHIATIAADGSGLEQLTSGDNLDQDPIWSPDGAVIAFKSNRPGPIADSGDHIWVMASDGTGQRQLDDGGGTATNAPAWGNR